MTEQEFVRQMHQELRIETPWPLFWLGYLIHSRRCRGKRKKHRAVQERDRPP